jgi:hypothetical protein
MASMQRDTVSIKAAILSGLISGAFAAGGAYAAIYTRLEALDQRVARAEVSIDRANDRIDRVSFNGKQ